MQAEAKAKVRDVRLDFFRGLALVFIFLDHMPAEVLGKVTLTNFGFSDASEVFVFISGYSAALAYAGKLERDGFGFTTARVLRRCWQLYVAHIFLFMVFTAEVAYLADRFSNPMFSEEMDIASLVDLPHVALMQALLLKFRPSFMAILPLYITLLGVFPLVLLGLARAWGLTLAASVALWAATRHFGWDLPSYPDGTVWFFNPLAWQLIFVAGAALGGRGAKRASLLRPATRRVLLPLAVAYLVFALAVMMAVDRPVLEHQIPQMLERMLFPLDKTHLDPLRLLHFLCLAYVVSCVFRHDSPLLRTKAARPWILCGRHSLEVFCFGTFLAFGCHFLAVAMLPGRVWDVVLSVGGVAAMMGLAWMLAWFQAAERQRRGGGAAA